MRVRSLVPIFRSFDEAKAREFYVDFLGFRVEFEHRFDPGAPLYLGLSLGGFELHVSEHFGDATPGSTARIEIDAVGEFCERLNAKAYTYARPGVQRQSWGYDEMAIDDPFGNRLIFCTNWDSGAETEQVEEEK